MSKSRRNNPPGNSTAFPAKQLFILGKFYEKIGQQELPLLPSKKSNLTDSVVIALCRICEPIAFMSIFPYIYFMIESFHLTTDDRQIAVYAGMVTSAFTIAEFSTGVLWGKLSDRIGRKPVLLTGLVGTGLSMLVFGFAPSLPVALFARALGGLLNGYAPLVHSLASDLGR